MHFLCYLFLPMVFADQLVFFEDNDQAWNIEECSEPGIISCRKVSINSKALLVAEDLDLPDGIKLKQELKVQLRNGGPVSYAYESTEHNIQGVFHCEENVRQITGTVYLSNQDRQFKLVQCKPLKENEECTLWMEVDSKIEPDSKENQKPRQATGTCKCGGPFSSSRIVGGQVVQPHSVPYQVGLTTAGGTVPFCGGSLISPNYVLTAAHCTIGRTAASLRVIVGDHSFTVTGDGEQYFNVQTNLVHPNYNPSSFLANDYSILKLSTPVNIPSATTGIVCLPPDVSQTFAGSILTVSGWGLTSGGGFQSPVLKSAFLSGITNADCLGYFGPGSIGPYHICAVGNVTSSSACNGDSGGPLTALINGKLTVVGIVSFGRTSCTPSVPNGYARVTDQKDWIISNSDAKDYQCIVQDGNWGAWSNFSCCSTSCGRGLQVRSRECNNPVPGPGGLSCRGDFAQMQFCNEQNPCAAPAFCTTASYKKMNGMCACAFYLGRGMSWTSANSTCRSLGARLPEIMNLQENDDIYKLMPKYSGRYAEGLWLGATNAVPKGTFFWESTKSPIIFNMFVSPNPDGDGNCLHMWSKIESGHRGGLWNDIDCNGWGVQETVCEILHSCS